MPSIERYDTGNASVPNSPKPVSPNSAKPEAQPTRADVSRANGAMSKGPVTEEGKARSSKNALKHGLRAGSPLAPGEDPAEYEAHQAELRERLQPVDALQEFLCDRIASCAWRLRRIPGIEAHMIGPSLNRIAGLEPGANWASDPSCFIALTRYERGIERSLLQSLETFRTLQTSGKKRN